MMCGSSCPMAWMPVIEWRLGEAMPRFVYRIAKQANQASDEHNAELKEDRQTKGDKSW